MHSQYNISFKDKRFASKFHTHTYIIFKLIWEKSYSTHHTLWRDSKTDGTLCLYLLLFPFIIRHSGWLFFDFSYNALINWCFPFLGSQTSSFDTNLLWKVHNTSNEVLGLHYGQHKPKKKSPPKKKNPSKPAT